MDHNEEPTVPSRSVTALRATLEPVVPGRPDAVWAALCRRAGVPATAELVPVEGFHRLLDGIDHLTRTLALSWRIGRATERHLARLGRAPVRRLSPGTPTR